MTKWSMVNVREDWSWFLKILKLLRILPHKNTITKQKEILFTKNQKNLVAIFNATILQIVCLFVTHQKLILMKLRFWWNLLEISSNTAKFVDKFLGSIPRAGPKKRVFRVFFFIIPSNICSRGFVSFESTNRLSTYS